MKFLPDSTRLYFNYDYPTHIPWFRDARAARKRCARRAPKPLHAKPAIVETYFACGPKILKTSAGDGGFRAGEVVVRVW